MPNTKEGKVKGNVILRYSKVDPKKTADELSLMFDSNETYAMLNDSMLPIRFYDPKDIEYSEKYAYAYDGYFYLYLGSCLRSIKKGPGIFWDPEKMEYYMIPVDESNPKEVADFKICPDHIAILDPASILDDIKSNRQEIYSKQDKSSKTFCPKIDVNDDILKRITKEIIIEKDIDIDQIRDRFRDKNTVFNYKQVVKGDGKMSWMIFERGLEAYNLVAVLTVVEADPNFTIGTRLEKPISARTDDTFEI